MDLYRGQANLSGYTAVGDMTDEQRSSNIEESTGGGGGGNDFDPKGIILCNICILICIFDALKS